MSAEGQISYGNYSFCTYITSSYCKLCHIGSHNISIILQVVQKTIQLPLNRALFSKPFLCFQLGNLTRSLQETVGNPQTSDHLLNLSTPVDLDLNRSGFDDALTYNIERYNVTLAYRETRIWLENNDIDTSRLNHTKMPSCDKRVVLV